MDAPEDRKVQSKTPGRTRGWVPALTVAVVAAAGLWALELLSDVGVFARLRADHESGSGGLWAGLIGGRITFFDDDRSALFGSADDTVRVLVSTAAVLLVGYVVTWLGTVGLRARAVLPLFLSAWLAAVLAGAGGLVAAGVDLQIAGSIPGGLVANLGELIDTGASYGVVYGWIPALLAALFWGATPARRRVSALDAEPEPDTGETDLRGILGEERTNA